MEHRLINFRDQPERPAAPESRQQTESVSDAANVAQQQLLREQRHEASQFVNSNEAEFSRGFETVLAELLEQSRGKDFANVNMLPATASFLQQPVIRELTERYRSSSSNVRALLVRRVAEICDRVCRGRPEQYVLFRQLFRVAPADVRSADGTIPQTQEELTRALQKSNRVSLGLDDVSDRELMLAVGDVLPDVEVLIRQALNDGSADGSTLARLLNHDSPDMAMIARSLDFSGISQRPAVRVLQWLHNRTLTESNVELRQSVESSLKETVQSSLKGHGSSSAIDALARAILPRGR